MRLPLPVTPVAAKGERTWREGVRLNGPNGVSVYRHVLAGPQGVFERRAT